MYYIQESTDNEATWRNLDKCDTFQQAKGSLGHFNAKKKPGSILRIKEVLLPPLAGPRRRRPHISFVLGAVAAKMWLNGRDLEDIDHYLKQQFSAYQATRKQK